MRSLWPPIAVVSYRYFTITRTIHMKSTATIDDSSISALDTVRCVNMLIMNMQATASIAAKPMR